MGKYLKTLLFGISLGIFQVWTTLLMFLSQEQLRTQGLIFVSWVVTTQKYSGNLLFLKSTWDFFSWLRAAYFVWVDEDSKENSFVCKPETQKSCLSLSHFRTMGVLVKSLFLNSVFNLSSRKIFSCFRGLVSAAFLLIVYLKGCFAPNSGPGANWNYRHNLCVIN